MVQGISHCLFTGTQNPNLQLKGAELYSGPQFQGVQSTVPDSVMEEGYSVHGGWEAEQGAGKRGSSIGSTLGRLYDPPGTPVRSGFLIYLSQCSELMIPPAPYATSPQHLACIQSMIFAHG